MTEQGLPKPVEPAGVNLAGTKTYRLKPAPQWRDNHFKYVRTISIKSSAASSADFVFARHVVAEVVLHQLPMRLLMAPRAAERRCRTSVQGSS